MEREAEVDEEVRDAKDERSKDERAMQRWKNMVVEVVEVVEVVT